MHTVLIKSDDNEKKEFQLEENEVIYDGLERQGLQIPHGCLAGSCGSCKVLVLEGENNLSEPRAVEKDTVSHLSDKFIEKYGPDYFGGKNLRLACRARVKGNIKIEITKDKI